LFDPDRRGTGVAGLVVRIGNVVRAAIYGMVGLEAFRLARGLRGSGGRDAELWAGRVMNLPFGEWLIGVAGLIVVAYGISQIVTAARGKASGQVDTTRLPRAARRPLLNIARFGVAARAVIIVVLGVFLVRAALEHDPSQAADTRQSMIELVGMFRSRWTLAAIALGLVAYAVNQALQACCRRIRSPI
jgi:hypothetical protein